MERSNATRDRRRYSADSEPMPTRPAREKARLRSLDDLDGRTFAARKARELVAGLETDLGGADRLSVGQRELVKRIALAGALAEDIEARWLEGEPIEIGEYALLVGVQRRLCVTVGLERVPRPVDVTGRVLDAIRSAAR